MTSARDYELLADRFAGEALDADSEEVVRVRDRVRIRYNRVTNVLVFVNDQGFITSFFKPDSRRHRLPTNYDYYLSCIR